MSAHQLLSLLSQIRGELSSSPLIVLGVLAAMGFFGVLALAGSRLAALALVPVAAVWPVVNGRLEGPTLLALSWNHGVSAADLLSVGALAVALWRLLSPQVKRV